MEQKRYFAKKEFILRKIADSNVLVTVGSEVANFCGVITLNETATFLWKNLQLGATEDELIDKITKNYKIDELKAKEDVQKSIQLLIERKMVTYE